MTKQIINVGATANDKKGDSLRAAFTKVNENFTELYTSLGSVVTVGNFVFEENTMRLTNINGDDSTATQIEIAQPVRIESNLTVGGDVLPNGNLTSTLGSPTQKFHSIYVGTGSVYLGDARLSLEDGRIRSSVGFDVTGSVGTIDGAVDWVNVTGKPTIPADVSDLTDTNQILVQHPANKLQNGSFEVSLGIDGVVTFPDNLTVANSIIGKSSSTIISEETPGGTISETTEIESQIEIETTGIIIAKRTRVIVDDTVTTSTNEAGSTLTVNNSTASIKHYVEPDGPNNGSYMQVRTSSSGAVLEGVNETLNGTDYGRVIATQNAVTVNTSAEGVAKYWLFDYLGGLTLPTPTSQVFTVTFDSNHYTPTVGKPSLTLTSEPWQLEGQVIYEQNGTASLQLTNIWPHVVNPGYDSGDAFTFSTLVHGLSDYTLTITLNDVVLAGPAGWTANLAVSQLPAYPSSISANGAIKLTAGNESFIFGGDGSLHFPDGSFQGTAFVGLASTAQDLYKAGEIFIGIGDGVTTTQQWSFGTGGSLTLPQYNQIESIGSNATISLNGVGTNESIIELSTRVDGEMITSTFAMNPAYGIDLTSVRDVTITAGYDAATLKYDTWINAEAVWMEIRDQDAQIIAPGTRTWAGLPSYQAYPLLMDFVQNIPGGEIPPPGNMAPAALTAKTAYELWQAEQAGINVNITAKDQTWTFGNDGQLTVPGAIRKDGGLYLNSSGSTTAASVFVSGFAGSVILRTADNANNVSHELALDVNGNLRLPGNVTYPGGITQSRQDDTFCSAGVDTVVYTSTGEFQHAIKLFVMIEGMAPNGDGVNWDTQACDVIAVKGFANNIVHVTTYGVTYTSAAAFATFDGQWNATTNRIEITCRPVSPTHGVTVSVHAIEMLSNN